MTAILTVVKGNLYCFKGLLDEEIVLHGSLIKTAGRRRFPASPAQRMHDVGITAAV